ncbi:Transposase IS605, OrfB, C-terminal [Phytophthora cactorum]|nr:Transposase IS605, OrfB, C-terminal [Phytophthora cactorum]
MKRTGGRVVDCEEEYTSKACSGCGTIKTTTWVETASSDAQVLDRDVSAAKNIFHKNMGLLA